VVDFGVGEALEDAPAVLGGGTFGAIVTLDVLEEAHPGLHTQIMKVVVAGGSGQVGTVLARAFLARGDDVVTLTRGSGAVAGRAVTWDGALLGAWASEVDGADVIVNLAGRSVDCRYNAANRREIMDSRVQSMRAIGEAIAQAVRPPSVWLQAGTATIYAHTYDRANDEGSGVLGGGEPDVPDTWRFSIDVAKAWEGAVNLAAPEPLPNADFMRALRQAWGIRFGLPATGWMLEAGAFVMRTETELVAKSRRVVPGRLLEDGFEFHHPSWPEAADDLCSEWRARRGA
jgi:NAD dependent epimerase/dehydratase family enzyme